MRWWCGCLIVLCWCAAETARATDFPYVAYVNSADVYVRSGPGRNYYPTDKLPKGYKVEVYRHDPGGWLAIRPPKQSFSWVSSRHVDQAADGLAIVNAPRTVARVGSTFSDVRDVIQVRLDKGEKVELFGEPTADSPWCKIAPPAGEFRWVFSKYVDRGISADLVDGTDDADDHEPKVRLASGESEPAPVAAAPQGRTQPSGVSIASEEGRKTELNRIDLELSTMAAEEISAWSFEDLHRRADAVLQQSQTSVERGRARVLLDKLARFEEIKQRHETVYRSGAGSEISGAPAPRPATRAIDPRFDGVGKLSPVVSQKVGGPSYALVDSTNAVLSFVTPAPGVNLRPYVDKYVGVNGQRGYSTDLQRQHINVQRVTLIDVQRR